MSTTPIDLWDIKTFDSELAARLDAQSEPIYGYFTASRRLWLEREAQTVRGPMPSNPFGTTYYRLLDELTPLLHARTIRAWHHSRLTDDEVSDFIEHGPRPATMAGVRERLDRRVAVGDLRQEDAELLLASSPFQGDRAEARLGKFWLTSNPQEVDDDGVKPLLDRWGGESVNFSHLDGATADVLSGIGRGRVLEVAIPLAATPDAFSAAKATVAAHGRSLGAPGDDAGFDLYSTVALPSTTVLRVHTEGKDDYARLGREYPAGFGAHYDASRA